jgi:hypothetical protein
MLDDDQLGEYMIGEYDNHNDCGFMWLIDAVEDGWVDESMDV